LCHSQRKLSLLFSLFLPDVFLRSLLLLALLSSCKTTYFRSLLLLALLLRSLLLSLAKTLSSLLFPFLVSLSDWRLSLRFSIAHTRNQALLPWWILEEVLSSTCYCCPRSILRAMTAAASLNGLPALFERNFTNSKFPKRREEATLQLCTARYDSFHHCLLYRTIDNMSGFAESTNLGIDAAALTHFSCNSAATRTALHSPLLALYLSVMH
jgi:hypothetical protein